jgi:hypothetical protein
MSENRFGGQPSLRRGGERRVADLAAVQYYLAGQRRDGGGGPVGRCGGLAQQLDLRLGQAQLAEHRGVKGDAVAVADGEAGDLAENRVELRRGDRPAQPVETGEQGGRCGGGRRQVGYQAEIGRDAVEHGPAPGRGVIGRQDGELHDIAPCRMCGESASDPLCWPAGLVAIPWPGRALAHQRP